MSKSLKTKSISKVGQAMLFAAFLTMSVQRDYIIVIFQSYKLFWNVMSLFNYEVKSAKNTSSLKVYLKLHNSTTNF